MVAMWHWLRALRNMPGGGVLASAVVKEVAASGCDISFENERVVD
jgi:hypothetical protein